MKISLGNVKNTSRTERLLSQRIEKPHSFRTSGNKSRYTNSTQDERRAHQFPLYFCKKECGVIGAATLGAETYHRSFAEARPNFQPLPRTQISIKVLFAPVNARPSKNDYNYRNTRHFSENQLRAYIPHRIAPQMLALRPPLQASPQTFRKTLLKNFANSICSVEQLTNTQPT